VVGSVRVQQHGVAAEKDRTPSLPSRPVTAAGDSRRRPRPSHQTRDREHSFRNARACPSKRNRSHTESVDGEDTPVGKRQQCEIVANRAAPGARRQVSPAAQTARPFKRWRSQQRWRGSKIVVASPSTECASPGHATAPATDARSVRVQKVRRQASQRRAVLRRHRHARTETTAERRRVKYPRPTRHPNSVTRNLPASASERGARMSSHAEQRTNVRKGVYNKIAAPCRIANRYVLYQR